MRIFAICKTLNGGYESDKSRMKKSGIQVGDKIEVECAQVYDYYTKIWLVGHGDCFNSIYFDFVDENGEEHDLYRNERFRHYY